MNKIIYVDFKTKSVIKVEYADDKITLDEAKQVLGEEYFNEAMKLPLTEVKHLANHPDAWLGGSDEAYDVIFNYRQNKESA